MADKHTTGSTDPEKSADLPPYGSRNPDPITDTPGSHPIEVGVGAALGGAASGAAVGMVAGPIGAVIGAAVGAIAGGYAGKGVGELIDPTTEDNWLRESFGEKHYVGKGESYEHYEPAYKYAGQVESKFPGKSYSDIETHVKTDYERTAHAAKLPYEKAKPAIQDAYERTVQLRQGGRARTHTAATTGTVTHAAAAPAATRTTAAGGDTVKLHEEHLKVNKDTVQTGEVGIRKEVHTEHKQITVPVEREEIVIERRAVHGGTATTGDLKAEEIRIPVKEERVHVTKEAVVTEEVSVGKKKVTEQQTVGADVRKEELIVEKEGSTTIRDEKKK